ncbi:hypothetical protein B296_00033156 [Ensete ventricosum]|uniref:Aldehyde dehydrogenase domain-containing protein n=1 Tax=Ensete ventricosum TaxID=4639 RepID=A0A426XSB6_ENSVE|nr:hypothetical protein B296_00033156 [Ensete ventricosum]
MASDGLKLPEIKFTKLFINGCFVDAVSETFESLDPRNGEVIANIAAGDKEDVDLAVKAAREAFDHGKWPRMSGSVRFFLSHHPDTYHPANWTSATSQSRAGKGEDYDEICRPDRAARRRTGGTRTLKLSGEFQGYTLREPIGVVGHIIPWNFPTIMFFFKVAPALAAGCTMLVKPAEQTPLTALYFAHLAKQAGIPDGVLNVVTGFGATAGAAIASHMDVDKVSFTGSTEVGRLVMEAAARSNLKSVSLELGGKSPVIICDDADIDMAGEICVAGSRVYVQEGIYDEFVRKIAESSKTWIVGDPFSPHVHQGPQVINLPSSLPRHVPLPHKFSLAVMKVDKKQFEKVLRYIDHGKREGATILTGGKACGEKGFYVEPTIFTDVKESMLIAQDEIFGPVMSLMRFKTIEEAIERANDTRYGLAAGIVTKDINIANRLSRSIRAGIIWINCYVVFDSDCPFGGYKMSGFGRDNGMHALEKYLQVKSVVVPIFGSPWL